MPSFTVGRASSRPRRCSEETGRPRVVCGDAKDLLVLSAARAGYDDVYHFASKPDIARAAREPTIDFWEVTYPSQNVVEAARLCGVARLTYSYGSGVYGDTGEDAMGGRPAPPRPVSTCGANKLAGEALIGTYNAIFGLRAVRRVRVHLF